MIRISHEVPLSLLKDSWMFNGYDYCLPHLLSKYPEYKEYFQKARQDGRFIIMDNGLFEDVAHTEEELLEYIDLIQPNIFVSPDVWNDTITTYYNYTYWKEKVDPSKLMVVIQAESSQEAIDLYVRLVQDGVKYIGFNHSGVFYQDFSSHPDPVLQKTLGRIEFVSYLKTSGLLSSDVHHHLLGCNTGEEFMFYRNLFPEIKTLDTSNPVALAYEHKTYRGPLNTKPSTKIDTLMEVNDSEFDARALKNINDFKNKFL
jgi:hypothetical protein